MWKIYICYLIINIININEIESCSGSSPKPECPEYTYKNYQDRQTIMSDLPNDRPIGHLSFIGTHQSMSYTSTNLNFKTQELSVTNQLRHGARVLHVTVRLQDQILHLYSREKSLDHTLFHLLYEIEQFLHFYPNELLVLLMDYSLGNLSTIYDHAHTCKTVDNYIKHSVAGWRLIKNWTLTDTIGKHRGKILMATYDPLLFECVHPIDIPCVLSEKIYDSLEHDLDDDEDQVEYHWKKYVRLSKENNSYNCKTIIYDLSIRYFFNRDYNPRSAAKYGGYKDPISKKCIVPINYRLGNENFNNIKLGRMNIFIVDYITQEIIDRFNFLNAFDSKN